MCTKCTHTNVRKISVTRVSVTRCVRLTATNITAGTQRAFVAVWHAEATGRITCQFRRGRAGQVGGEQGGQVGGGPGGRVRKNWDGQCREGRTARAVGGGGARTAEGGTAESARGGADGSAVGRVGICQGAANCGSASSCPTAGFSAEDLPCSCKQINAKKLEIIKKIEQ
jgi:hypothetical protein